LILQNDIRYHWNQNIEGWKMRRQLVIYVSVIVAVLVVVLPVVVTMHNTTVTGEGGYGMNIGYVFFNLQAEQSVNGWFSFSDNAVASDNSPYFVICDPLDGN